MVTMLIAAIIFAAPASVVSLRPGMPAIERSEAPPLYAGVPDADRVEPHLWMRPETPYQWVIEAGASLLVQAGAGARCKGQRALLTVWDWNRVPVWQQAFAVPFEQAVRFAVGGRGTYLLTLDLFSGEQPAARLVRSFSACPSNEARRESWRKGEFLVGACSFPGRQHWSNDFGPAHPPGLSEQASREKDADLSARLGMQIARLDLPLEWPSGKAPIDFSRADASIECFVKRGFRLDMQLYGPGWDWAILPKYRDVKDPKWRYPPRPELHRRLMAECVKRYARHAAFFEINNEPDNLDFWRGTPEEYIAYARRTAEEVRRVVPRALVGVGGYTMILPESAGKIARGLRDVVSMVGYHSHGGVQSTQEMLRAMQAVHAAAGYARPTFYNTEMGYAAWRLDQEREMAATAVQKLLYCWSHGNRGALLYCSRDIGGPRGGDWGYLDYFFCPRFMYGAVAAFIDTYAGARFERTLTETPQLHAYAFRAGSRILVALFTPDNQERSVALETNAATATLIDPMGNRRDLPAASRIEVAAGYYPICLSLEGTAEVRVIP